MRGGEPGGFGPFGRRPPIRHHCIFAIYE